MQAVSPFFNLYSHDLVRVAVGIPAVRVADPAFNAERTIELMKQAADERAVVALFPELGLSAYSCDDLFHQRALLDGCQEALRAGRRGVARPPAGRGGRPAARRSITCCSTARRSSRAARSSASCRRRTCRTTASSTRRASSTPRRRRAPRHRSTCSASATCRSAAGLLFQLRGAAAADLPRRDLRGPLGADPAVVVRRAGRRDGAAQPLGLEHHHRQGRIPPRARRRAVGALPGGLPVLRGRPRRVHHRPRLGRPRADRRERQPAGRVGALRHRAAACHAPRSTSSGCPQERMRQTTLRRQTRRTRPRCRTPSARSASRSSCPPTSGCCRRASTSASRTCPSDPRTRDERCAEVYNIQVQGLAKRLQFTGIEKVVIGVSGGLDSTQALLVCAQAMDRLGLPRSNILGLHDARLRHQRAHAASRPTS